MVSWYGAQILTHVDTVVYLLLCDVFGEEGPRIKVANDRGWHILGFIPQEGGSRPCVSRQPGRFSGRPARGVPMWQ